MKKRLSILIKNKFWFLSTLIILFLVNIVATIFHTKIDLTAEKRFTLSNATKKLLRNIENPVEIEVFLKGNFPSGFKQLASSTNDMLLSFKEIAGGKLQYKFTDPSEKANNDSTYADHLSAYGLYPINLTSQVKEGQNQQYVYPFAIAKSGNNIIPIELYKGKTPLISHETLSSANAMLEYNIANAIGKALEKEKSIIGYAIGNNEPEEINTYDLVENMLSPNYQLFTFNPNTQPVIPQSFKILLVVKPAIGFSENAKLKLDQYVMNGGKIIWMIDRLNAELDSLQKGRVVAYDRELKINDLLFKYGIRINPNLLMDLQCDFLPFDVNNNGQYELLPWNYFPVMESASNHPINKNLGFVSGHFVNSIDTLETEGIRKTILLQSSSNARVIGTPAIISPSENETAPQSQLYKQSAIPTAVLLEGKFASMYANRLTTEMRDSLQKYNAAFVANNAKENSMIVISDGDLALNSTLKGNPIPMGMNPYTFGTQREFEFANKVFLQNCIDYMINANDLSEAKAKDYIARLLDQKKVEEQKSFWQIINIGLPLLIVLIFAIAYNFYRKQRYR